MKMIKSGVLLVMLLGGYWAAAATWYVSKDGSDTNGGTGWDDAKLTIQGGINAAAAGDTVVVSQGVYSAHSETGGTVNTTISSVTYKMPCVVLLNKAITLVSANTNRAETIIEGLWDPAGKGVNGTSFEGLGPKAVRGIYVSVDHTRIIGFTIRNCATINAGSDNSSGNSGAGINACFGDTFICDCDITDCRAGEGAAIGSADNRTIYMYGCHFARNKASGTSQVFYRTMYHRNCLFEENGRSTGAGCIATIVQGTTFANCTFLNNNVSVVLYPNESNTCEQYLYNCDLITENAASSASPATNWVWLSHCAQVRKTGLITLDSDHMTNCTNNFAKTETYFSPIAGDWSQTTGSPLLDAGTNFVHAADQTAAGSYWAGRDYLGNQRKVGTIDIGCFEDQTGGKDGALVTVKAAPLAFDSHIVIPGTNLWAHCPARTAVRVTPGWTTGEELFNIWTYENLASAITNQFLRWPDVRGDQGLWYTMPGTGHGVTFEPKKSAGTVYADANYDGSNGASNGTESRPYTTLSNAIAKAGNYYVIKVRPGVYDKEGYQNVDGVPARVSLNKHVALRATGKASETIVVGGKEGNVEPSIFRAASNGMITQVQGMTLTGVNSTGTRSAFYANANGGSFNYVYGRNPRISDCIISNNVSYQAAGIFGSMAERCYFANNRTGAANYGKGSSGARGSTAKSSILSGCVIESNEESNDVTFETTVINCTFFGPFANLSNKVSRAANQTSRVYNCAIGDNYMDGAYAGGILQGCVRTYGNSQSVGAAGMTNYPKTEDYFANGEAGEYHPVRGAAGLTQGAWSDKYHIFEVGAIDCKKFTYPEAGSGKPYPGAYQEGWASVYITNDVTRSNLTSPSGRVATDSDSVEVTFTETTHPYLGYVVNGVTNQATAKMVTISTAGKGIVNVEPVYSHDFYVDAENGDDARSGWTPETAKETLTAILTNRVSGDVVHAAAGVYDKGWSIYSSYIWANHSKKVKTRAIVPAGVSLIGHDKNDTFIKGYHDPYGEDNCAYGRGTGWGTNAVRCVTALAGSTIRGFTIHEGATRAQTGGECDANVGACVLAPEYNVTTKRASTSTVIDCIIYGGVARSSVTVKGGIYVKCRITGGLSPSGSGMRIGSNARFEQCLLLNNNMSSSLTRHWGMMNCTLFSDQTTTDGELAANDSRCPIVNSVFCFYGASNNGNAYTITRVKNNLIRHLGSSDRPTFDSTCTNNYFAANWNEFGLSAIVNNTWCAMPSKTSMTLVGKNDAQTVTSYLDEMIEGDTDIFGVPRVLGGKLDFGCFEYDWRVDFEEALRMANFGSIPTVASNATLVAEGVSLPSGEMTMVLTGNAGSRRDFPVEVTGNGTLTVSVGGQVVKTVTAADGEQNCSVEMGEGGAEVLLAYAPGANDTGVAMVKAFKPKGLMMILR